MNGYDWAEFQRRAEIVNEELENDPESEDFGWTECSKCRQMNIPIVGGSAPEFCPDCDPDNQ